VYISFITDVYSHKIVGYHVGETKEAAESLHVDIPDNTDPCSGHIDPSKNGFGSIIY